MELGKYSSAQEKTGNTSLMSNTDNSNIAGRKDRKEKKNKNFDVRDLFHVIFNPNQQPGQSEMGIPSNIQENISLSTYNLDSTSPSFLPIGLHPHETVNRKESIGIGNIFNFKSNKMASPNVGSSPTKDVRFRKSFGIAKFNPNDGSISVNQFLLKSASLSRGLTRPSMKNLQSWEKSFDSLLNDEFGLYLFTEFLKTEFSQENIEFWIACEEYKKLSGSKMTKEAQRIYRTHLSVQSPKEVNLDSKTRLQTIASLNAPNRLVFDAAQKKIQALMEKDSYRRFLRSQTYLSIKNQLEEDHEIPASQSMTRSPNSSHKQLSDDEHEDLSICHKSNTLPVGGCGSQVDSSNFTVYPKSRSSREAYQLQTSPSTLDEQTILPNPVFDSDDCKLTSPELL